MLVTVYRLFKLQCSETSIARPVTTQTHRFAYKP
jgi:hypothetical protein